MSIKTYTFCDLCGKEINSSNWSTDPASLTINISHPTNARYEFNHVCHGCVIGFQRALALLKTKDLPTTAE